MASEFTVIIPARYASTRLPGKPLQVIGRESLIQNAFTSASKSQAKFVCVATDDPRIADAVNGFNGNVVMTDNDLISGTDRVHQAAIKLGLSPDDTVVNLQGDQYNFDPEHINRVAELLTDNPMASIATLSQIISSVDDLHNESIAKVVIDNNGMALYFSRSSIPWSNNENISLNIARHKHIGIYAYRKKFLDSYVDMEAPDIERLESLEQLRALYYGYKIYVEPVKRYESIEVNTRDDLEAARVLAGQL
jgi:3-deoxy-manno-octulosonate cytidylyltransferase (CMP-KDO synthetase)